WRASSRPRTSTSRTSSSTAPSGRLAAIPTTASIPTPSPRPTSTSTASRAAPGLGRSSSAPGWRSSEALLSCPTKEGFVGQCPRLAAVGAWRALKDRAGEGVLAVAILDLDHPEVGVAVDGALDIGGGLGGGKRAADLEPAERAFGVAGLDQQAIAQLEA